MDKLVHDVGYGFIARKVMRNKDLSVESKAIYSYLASFAGTSGKAFPSVELMVEELGMSKSRFYKYMKELKEQGFIKVEQEKEDNRFKRNVYYLIDSPCTRFEYTEIEDTQFEHTENRDTNNNNLNNNNLNINKDNKNICQAEKKEDEQEENNQGKIPYKKIIEYLNLKANKSYSSKSRGNKSAIQARWNEGYCLEDFKRVIDIKTDQWLKDEKMNTYLRPSTLFSQKFDNYLNEEVNRNGRISTDSRENEKEFKGKKIGCWL